MKKNNIPLNFTEKNNSRVSLIASIATLLILCLLIHTIDKSFALTQAEASAKEAAQQEAELLKEKTVTTSATILAAGDNFYGENLLNVGKSDNEDWNYDEIYNQISTKISSADLSIVQQPTIFTDDHDMMSGTDPYATCEEVADSLVNAGFDVIASAGSHSDDYGVTYINQTVDYWNNNHPDITLLGLHKTQQDADTIQVREVNGIKIAFLNYSYGSNYDALPEESSFMVDYFQKDKVASDIQKAKELSDCIIVMAQWGGDGNAVPTEYQKQWTQFLLSQGVKVVIGGHPHVLQPYETLRDDQGNEMLVYYSLGNFASSATASPELLGGLAEFTFEKTEVDGEVQEMKVTASTLTPTVMHYNAGEDVYQVMLLSDYTDELASAHSVQSLDDAGTFSVNTLNTLFDHITSQNVTASTNTDLLDMTCKADGSMVKTDGTVVSADELAVQYPLDTSGSLDALKGILDGGSSSDSDDTSSEDADYDSGDDSNYNSGYDSDYDSDY